MTIDKEHGKYRGLARVAMQIAEEESRTLDEIEGLLDAGEYVAAIAAVRKLIGARKTPYHDDPAAITAALAAKPQETRKTPSNGRNKND
jgi:hypothetical protein